MKISDNAVNATKSILAMFEQGKVPEVLANVFLSKDHTKPMSQWSFSNQCLAVFSGTTDARTFNQWKEVNRHVKKGAKAIPILAPITITDDEVGSDGKKKIKLVGFRGMPVFAIEDTDGMALPPSKHAEFISNLPLMEVAKKWGIGVGTMSSHLTGAAGGYSPSSEMIYLGVENMSTWVHELVHAADNRLGTLTKGKGQCPDNEVVAELGGAVLLSMTGHPVEADLGGCHNYISKYAKEAGQNTVPYAMSLIKRIGACVTLILSESKEFSGLVIDTEQPA